MKYYIYIFLFFTIHAYPNLYGQNEWELIVGKDKPIKGLYGAASKSGELIIWGSSLKKEASKLDLEFTMAGITKIDSTIYSYTKGTFILVFDKNGNKLNEKQLTSFPLDQHHGYTRFSKKIDIHPLFHKIYINDDALTLKNKDKLVQYSLLNLNKTKNDEVVIGGILASTPYLNKGYVLASNNIYDIRLFNIDSTGKHIWQNRYSFKSTQRENHKIFKFREEEFTFIKSLYTKMAKDGDIIVVCSLTNSKFSKYTPVIFKIGKNREVKWSRIYLNFDMDIFYNDLHVSKNEEIFLCSNKGQIMKLNNDGKMIWCKKFEDISITNFIEDNDNRCTFGGFGRINKKYSPIVLQIDFDGNIIGQMSYTPRTQFESKNASFFKGINKNIHLITGKPSNRFQVDSQGLILLSKEFSNISIGKFEKSIKTSNVKIDYFNITLNELKL